MLHQRGSDVVLNAGGRGWRQGLVASTWSAVLLAVFAHPDDETFRCGGTLALLATRGVRVHILTATRGEVGSCGDPPLCLPEELAAWRERELRGACQALGLEPPIVLGYADGMLAEADPEEIIERIVRAVRQLRPQVMLSFGPEGLSGHPDHIAIAYRAAEASRRAGDASAYPEQLSHGSCPMPRSGSIRSRCPEVSPSSWGCSRCTRCPTKRSPFRWMRAWSGKRRWRPFAATLASTA